MRKKIISITTEPTYIITTEKGTRLYFQDVTPDFSLYGFVSDMLPQIILGSGWILFLMSVLIQGGV